MSEEHDRPSERLARALGRTGLSRGTARITAQTAAPRLATTRTAAQTGAPRRAARLIRVREPGAARATVPRMRELLHTAGELRGRRRAPARRRVWTRIAGDAVDLTSLRRMMAGRMGLRRVMTGRAGLRRMMAGRMGLGRAMAGRAGVRRMMVGRTGLRRAMAGRTGLRRMMAGRMGLGRAMAGRTGWSRRRLAATAGAAAAAAAADAYVVMRFLARRRAQGGEPSRREPGAEAGTEAGAGAKAAPGERHARFRRRSEGRRDEGMRERRAAAREGEQLGGMEVHSAITVRRPRGEVYRFWRDVENFPRFMVHVMSVESSDGRSHWRVRGPAGRPVEWDAEITEDRPGELIAWRSTSAGAVATGGSIRFADAPGGRGTEVRVRMTYDVPGGRAGLLLARLTGEHPGQRVRDDLRRFKQVMETGEVVRSEGSPEGARALRQARRRPAQPVG